MLNNKMFKIFAQISGGVFIHKTVCVGTVEGCWENVCFVNLVVFGPHDHNQLHISCVDLRHRYETKKDRRETEIHWQTGKS